MLDKQRHLEVFNKHNMYFLTYENIAWFTSTFVPHFTLICKFPLIAMIAYYSTNSHVQTSFTLLKMMGITSIIITLPYSQKYRRGIYFVELAIFQI